MRLIVCAAVAATASAFVAPGPSQAARQAVKISASSEGSTCRRRGDVESALCRVWQLWTPSTRRLTR